LAGYSRFYEAGGYTKRENDEGGRKGSFAQRRKERQEASILFFALLATLREVFFDGSPRTTPLSR
jgi:hypothetical protein